MDGPSSTNNIATKELEITSALKCENCYFTAVSERLTSTLVDIIDYYNLLL
jgi:hypothetical protein